MKRLKHIIDPNKLAETFNVSWEKTDLLTDIEKDNKKESFIFNLGEEKQKPSLRLIFNHHLPNHVLFWVETKNGYSSSIEFNNITKVIYIPQYHAVRLESHTKTHFSILKIYGRGQFDLGSNWEEKIYPESVWGQEDK